VRAGEAFDYNLVVSFLKDSTGVVVNDELPAQLTATSTPASWKSVTVNNANPSGGEKVAASLTLFSISAVLYVGCFTVPAACQNMSCLLLAAAWQQLILQRFQTSCNPAALHGWFCETLYTSLSPPLLMHLTSTALRACLLLHHADCQTTTTAGRQRVTCPLGASFIWKSGDRVEVRVPVVANANATGTINNTAAVTDNLNRTAEDNHPTDVTIPPGVRAPVMCVTLFPAAHSVNLFGFEVAWTSS
jgi:hypothetical protein